MGWVRGTAEFDGSSCILRGDSGTVALWRSCLNVSIHDHDNRLRALTAEQRDLYARHIARMRKMIPVSQKLAVPAEKVSAVVEEALTARRPRARYVVGVGPKLQMALMTNLPVSVRDRVLRRVSGQP